MVTNSGHNLIKSPIFGDFGGASNLRCKSRSCYFPELISSGRYLDDIIILVVFMIVMIFPSRGLVIVLPVSVGVEYCIVDFL